MKVKLINLEMGLIIMDLKRKFVIVYSNLPINLRKEIIYVGKTGPVSWDVAYNEVFNDTKLGKEILKRLSAYKII